MRAGLLPLETERLLQCGQYLFRIIFHDRIPCDAMPRTCHRLANELPARVRVWRACVGESQNSESQWPDSGTGGFVQLVAFAGGRCCHGGPIIDAGG